MPPSSEPHLYDVPMRGDPDPKAIAQLPLFHRTPAVRFDGGDEGKDRYGGVKFAVWEERLRETRRTQTPFDGVVKVERIIMLVAYSKIKTNATHVYM